MTTSPVTSATIGMPGHPALRVGTRASLLARTQSGLVADALRRSPRAPRDNAAHEQDQVELVDVTTHGDVTRAPLASMGGVGVFVGALREALLAGEVDVAVHSLKDLPTSPAKGICLAAVPLREDPRDVIVARNGLTLGELPSGSTVATGSPRRAAQLAALGLGLDIVDIRGNVDTRVQAVTDGKVDAVILAHAGLSRLGRLSEVSEVLDPLQMLPAPGQGALAVECRADDEQLVAHLRSVLDHPLTRIAVTAERALLATLEGGCSAPVGALAEVAEGDSGDELWLRAVALSTDGMLAVRRSATGAVDGAAALGRDLAQQMLDDGAGELLTAGAS